MQHNSQQADSELPAAEALDAWITARLAGREKLASLPNLPPQAIELTALAHDLIALAEETQPEEEFVMHLVASLKGTALHQYLAKYRFPPFTHRTPQDEDVEPFQGRSQED